MSFWLKARNAALAAKNELMGRPMTADGGEIHDPTPVAPPVGFNPTLSFEQRIIQTLRSEQLQQALEAQGEETFADMHDFGPDDDDDEIFPASRFEQVALDAQRMGADYRRSKAERERLEEVQDRLADRIADALRVNDDFEELEESRRPEPRRRSSGARPRLAREGRQDGPNPPSQEADPD